MHLPYSGIAGAVALALALAGSPALAQAPTLGADTASLLDYARSHHPGFQAERADAQAAFERIAPAAALPDPSFEIERMDATNANQGGETRYRINQTLPFWGKRDLNTRAAEARAGKADALSSAAWLQLAAELKTAWLRYWAAERTAALNRDLNTRAAEARAGKADALSSAAWLQLAAELKTAWLRYWAAERTAALNRDALTLLQGLEETTLARYRLGLLPQQAVLRAQREITAQRLTLVSVEQRRVGAAAAVNALLARTDR